MPTIRAGRYRYMSDKNKTDELRAMYQILCESNWDVPRKVEITAVRDMEHPNEGLAFQRSRQIVISRNVWYYEEGRQYIRSMGWAPAPPRPGYLCYVLCHELAHIKVSDGGDFKTSHEGPFQEALKLICPQELQHYEYTYMPDHALAAGVEHRADFT